MCEVNEGINCEIDGEWIIVHVPPIPACSYRYLIEEVVDEQWHHSTDKNIIDAMLRTINAVEIGRV